MLGLQLRNSIKPVQELLSERTKRLSLNEKSFKVYTSASLMSIDEMFEVFFLKQFVKFVIIYYIYTSIFNNLFNI